MRQRLGRQSYMWLLSGVVLSLSLLGCTPRQPSQVQVEPITISTVNIAGLPAYAVDRIEEDIAILLPRSPRGESITVPYDLLSFAKEGDIVCATGDPTHPYVLDQEATARLQRDIAALLSRLKEPESAK